MPRASLHREPEPRASSVHERSRDTRRPWTFGCRPRAKAAPTVVSSAPRATETQPSAAARAGTSATRACQLRSPLPPRGSSPLRGPKPKRRSRGDVPGTLHTFSVYKLTAAGAAAGFWPVERVPTGGRAFRAQPTDESRALLLSQKASAQSTRRTRARDTAATSQSDITCGNRRASTINERDQQADPRPTTLPRKVTDNAISEVGSGTTVPRSSFCSLCLIDGCFF